jgi:hypothetical protein
MNHQHRAPLTAIELERRTAVLSAVQGKPSATAGTTAVIGPEAFWAAWEPRHAKPT